MARDKVAEVHTLHAGRVGRATTAYFWSCGRCFTASTRLWDVRESARKAARKHDRNHDANYRREVTR